jgi:3'(2'), 5'-bisphosphate nucleotidase
MTAIDLAAAAEHALLVAKGAAEIVMRVYATPFGVDYKGANDPVTDADREANSFIVDALAKRYPGVPIVAEESDPVTFGGYGGADAVWFVDPLDGTREFVAKNGEFAVMIGLAVKGRAAMGVLVCPAEGRSYVGVVGGGAWEVSAEGARKPLRVSSETSLAHATVVVSRSHRPPFFDAAMRAVGAAAVVPTGSSGLKAARVSSGEAEVYLQPGPAGMLWDACAPEAVIRAAGGKLTDARGGDFDYRTQPIVNPRGLVATNGVLHDEVIARLAPVLPATLPSDA